MILAQVYRDADGGDFTNGGITATHDRVEVVTETEPLPKNYGEVSQYPILRIQRKKHMGRDFLYAEPEGDKNKPFGWFFGGNYVMSHHQHFPSDYPIPVHDRSETKEEYDALSI